MACAKAIKSTVANSSWVEKDELTSKKYHRKFEDVETSRRGRTKVIRYSGDAIQRYRKTKIRYQL